MSSLEGTIVTAAVTTSSAAARSDDATANANTQVPEQPVFLRPKFERMPAELRQRPNWVLWVPVWNGSKWTKRPIQPSGFGASSTKPKHWSTFEASKQAYEAAVRRGYIELREKNKPPQRVPIGGVGFVFDGRPDENGLVCAGVDFDKVITRGEIAPFAMEHVKRLASYTERSVSGDGLHVIVRARPLQTGVAHNGVEAYTCGRFFTMTGRAPEDAQVAAVPDEFAALAEELQKEAGHGAVRDVSAPMSNVVAFKLPEWAANGRQAAAFDHLPADSLAVGLEPNIEQIRSAVATIPPSAIATEADWMKMARALAHEAAVHKGYTEQLRGILDTASRSAPNYNQQDNDERFQRYISEAFNRSNPITINTLFQMALDHGWHGRSPPLVPPASAPPIWSAVDLNVSFAHVPHRRWLYGTYLIRGEITVLAAPGGAGKTALATGMAVEIATGVELLGEKIFGGDLKVLFINAEDGGAEITRRIFALCLANASKIPVQSPDRLYVAGADDARVQRLSFLRTTDKNFSMLDESGFKVLEDALVSLHADLVILDPLVAFCGGGNMNDNAVMSQVIRELKRLAAKFDCAVLMVHHTRKGNHDGDPEAISGAAATVNLARRAVMPVPMTKEEATSFGVFPSERFRYFKLVDAKSNLAPRSTDSPWYKLHSVELPNSEPPIYPHGDNVQAVERVNFVALPNAVATPEDQKIRSAILGLVEHGKMIDGQSYPYSPSAAGANNVRSMLADAMAAVRTATTPREWPPDDLKAATNGAIKKMTAEGLLVVKGIKELSPNPGRFRRACGLAVNRARSPSHISDSSTAANDATALEGGQLVNDTAND